MFYNLIQSFISYIKTLQAVPGINVVKFPTNAQPAVLRALLSGTIQVAVERPETLQYYNSKVTAGVSSSNGEKYFFLHGCNYNKLFKAVWEFTNWYHNTSLPTSALWH